MKIAGKHIHNNVENENKKFAKNQEMKCNIMHQCTLCNSSKHVIRFNDANFETRLLYFKML